MDSGYFSKPKLGDFYPMGEIATGSFAGLAITG